MTLPKNISEFPEIIDPSDLVDFTMVLSQGPLEGEQTMLVVGEGVATYSLSVGPEGVAAGLRIEDGEGYTPSLTNNRLTFYVSINPEQRADPMFLNDGVQLPVELTLITTSVPPRRKQRTALIRVRQL